MPRTAGPKTPAQNLADAQAKLEALQVKLERAVAVIRATIKHVRDAQKAAPTQ